MPHLSRAAARAVIRRALVEDRARQDITSASVLPRALRLRARIRAKAPGILAGGSVAAWTFHLLDPRTRCVLRRREGGRLRRGDTILTVEGTARAIFAAERTALNLLGHLSGIATLTHAYVRRVPPRVHLLDTRKTLPGLRTLEKYAVRVGGGQSHRWDLEDAVLIKTNHLRALGPRRLQAIQQAVRAARRNARGKRVEIEVTTLAEFEAALTARPDAILLDNWPAARLRQAVRLRGRRHTIRLEASGGVTLAIVRAIARTGVDDISIGRLTHSAPSLDVSLQVLP